MTRFEVYRHVSPTGKSYVGFTSVGATRRFTAHIEKARAGSRTAFHAAIRKYGAPAFTHEVLEVMTTEAGAKRAEQLWIARLGTRAPAGYNLTDGGDGAPGYEWTAEDRARNGAIHRGKTVSAETRAAISRTLQGHKVSAETRKKLADAQQGRPMSDANRAALRRANVGRAPNGALISAAKKGITTPAMRAAFDRQIGRPLSSAHRASLREAWLRRKARGGT